MSNPAVAYERYMVPSLFTRALQPVLTIADPKPGERVLDVACGTGIVARTAAEQVGPTGRVAGIDISPNMLAVARDKADQEGLSIEWREESAETLPFADASFDLVLCQQGIQFVPDQLKAASEMNRVLDDGGRAVLSVWESLDRHPIYARLIEAEERHLGEAGPGGTQPFSFGDSDDLLGLLTHSGFREVEVKRIPTVAQFPDPNQWLSMMMASIAAVSPAAQDFDDDAQQAMAEAIRGDMEQVVAEHSMDGHVVIPFHGLIALAYR